MQLFCEPTSSLPDRHWSNRAGSGPCDERAEARVRGQLDVSAHGTQRSHTCDRLPSGLRSRTLVGMGPNSNDGEQLSDVRRDEPKQVAAGEDVARLEANLRLSPAQRLARATKAANFVLKTRRAMTAARNF